MYDNVSRSVKTIASSDKSIEYSLRIDTDSSAGGGGGKMRQIGTITSLCMEERLSQLANK